MEKMQRGKKTSVEPTTRVGLALQAGGALGAYEVGVIKALYKHYPHFRSNLHVVSGASAGAINATVLVGARGDNPVETLEQMWLERFAVKLPLVPEFLYPLLLPLTGIGGMGHLRPDFLVNPLLAPSIFDSAPMRQTLANLADEERINHSPIHLIVTAADVETGRLSEFKNHITGEPFTFEMALASGSLAPAFPMTTVTEQITGKEGRYWDGGFLATLPLSPVIDVLEQCDVDERVVIAVQVKPRRSRLPGNMLEIMSRFFELLTSSKLDLDRQTFEKTDARIDLLQQMAQFIPQDSELRKHPAYTELMSHRKIRCIVIETTRPETFGSANWSRSAIEDRIECGYEDAYDKLVEEGIVEKVSEYEHIPTLAAKGRGTAEEKSVPLTA